MYRSVPTMSPSCSTLGSPWIVAEPESLTHNLLLAGTAGGLARLMSRLLDDTAGMGMVGALGDLRRRAGHVCIGSAASDTG